MKNRKLYIPVLPTSSGNNMGKQKIKHEEFSQMVLPTNNDSIAVVEKMLGNDRMALRLMSGKAMTGRIIGKLRRRVWIREGDIVLVSPWEFESDKGDVFYRYTRDQVKTLKQKGYRVEPSTKP